ncbi:MAG: AraC family transcriptional regulator [Victivallaceae bacterium]|nr:AraC family transcriptional regulator [Victivallaceae bacterium]
MSRRRRNEDYNEEQIILSSAEGSRLLYMPLCGITRCRSDYRIARRNEPICVLEYIVKGEGTLRSDGTTFRPEADDVYVVHPWSDHEYYPSPENPWEKIWFNLQGELVDFLLEHCGLSDTFLLKKTNLQALFQTGLDRMAASTEDGTNVQQVALEVAVGLFHALGQVKAKQGCRQVNPVAEPLRNYLDRSIMQSLSMEEIARYAGFSPSQTNRLFQAQYHISPYAYFLDRKLQMARLMLRNTRKPVKEIAAELHFGSESYFSNLFRKKFHLSPRDCRDGEDPTEDLQR